MQPNPQPLPVQVRAGDVTLDGDLNVPPQAKGLVIFAHGSGSSRHSSRNKYVAAELNKGGLATLLLDLLTRDEERIDDITRELRFNIPMLAERLGHAAEWASQYPKTRGLPVGFFGASTGGGAALIAAASRPEAISAVVSRGGRPDLAGADLPRVRAPTLLIVGGADDVVIELNQQALQKLRCERHLEIVPGATHLFEEPGTLEAVARLARAWFQTHFRPAEARPAQPGG
ncbi:MAG: alpha/beta family hydrolase [Myxococcota bacterium]